MGELRALGVQPAVLESDALRQILTARPSYTDGEREVFYSQLADLGALLTRQGVPVIFDATANRRRYREQARKEIPRFFEVYVDCPLETCIARDPKGIYRNAREGKMTTVPGLQSTYEPPHNPDMVVYSDKEPAASAAYRIVEKLREQQLIAG